MIQVKQHEIEQLQNESNDIINDEGSRFHVLSYEQGIVDTLAWLQGDSEYPLLD